MAATKIFTVQSLSSGGPDRVNVSFSEIQDGGGAPMGASSFNLNLSQAEAADYDVNDRFSMNLSKQSVTSSSSTTSPTP